MCEVDHYLMLLYVEIYEDLIKVYRIVIEIRIHIVKQEHAISPILSDRVTYMFESVTHSFPQSESTNKSGNIL